MILRPYQEEISTQAADLLRKYKIAYLAMEVRTGKTMTAFATSQKYGAKNILFVTKLKAIDSIKNDLKAFDGILCHVINFEGLNKVKNDFDLIIIDESHGLGAFPKPSKRVKDLKPLCKGKPIIFLSGTPSPENYSQLYHQFFVSSYSPFAAYTNFYKWANTFVDKKIKYVFNRELIDYSGAKMDLIKDKIKHLFINYTQQEAGFDVKIKEKILYCEMNNLQKDCINALLKDRIIRNPQGAVVLADTAVKLQSKIHQLCGGTMKDEDGKVHFVSAWKAGFIAANFKGQKIAIYYKFIGEFELLKQSFPNWTASPEEFQTSTDKTFLGQFVSSREGIRLDTADAIVFYNIDFSFLSYEQARNRIVSKERTKEAVLYWIFTRGGIEEKIYKAVSNKKDYTSFYFKKDYGITSAKKTN